MWIFAYILFKRDKNFWSACLFCNSTYDEDFFLWKKIDASACKRKISVIFYMKKKHVNHEYCHDVLYEDKLAKQNSCNYYDWLDISYQSILITIKEILFQLFVFIFMQVLYAKFLRFIVIHILTEVNIFDLKKEIRKKIAIIWQQKISLPHC